MKFHNPFEVAVNAETPWLFLTLFSTGILLVALLIVFLSYHLTLTIALFVTFVVGRVGYAIIKGK